MTAIPDFSFPPLTLSMQRDSFAHRRDVLLQELATIDKVLEALDGYDHQSSGWNRTNVEPHIYQRETREGTVYEVKYRQHGKDCRKKCDTLLEARMERFKLGLGSWPLGQERQTSPSATLRSPFGV